MNRLVYIIIVGIVLPYSIMAQSVSDVYDKYTSVGQLGLTVTNFGVLGNGWNKIDGRILPSCQYKQNLSLIHI